jgi:hypothetical protein
MAIVAEEKVEIVRTVGSYEHQSTMTVNLNDVGNVGVYNEEGKLYFWLPAFYAKDLGEALIKVGKQIHKAKRRRL